ncbi:MAG: magnesium and cobalt transport protein CorA, partial [Planctomycetes bacterium]|nr:magnesium and cobalt transport protein CorA [Planctomycetota bacterium]
MLHIYSLTADKTIRCDVPRADIPRLLAEPGAVLWVDLDAPTDEERCLLDDPFAFHPLTIEDCRLVNNRPKIELHERYLFA